MRYTIKEAAEKNNNYVQHIRYLIKTNKIPYKRDPGSCHAYIDEAGLELLQKYQKRGYKKKEKREKKKPVI